MAAVQGNWEFYATADGRVRMRLHHSDSPSRRVRWSPDGNFVVSVGGGGAAKSVKVWDAHTGECLQTIIPGDGDPLLSVAISPDSKTIAVQGKQFEITLCDIASGKCIGILPGHTDLIFDLDWHPDGRRLVSGSTDNTCRIWNVQTGAELLTFRDAPSWVLSARFSHDGSLLVTGDANSLWGRMAPIRFYDATLPDIANESQR